MQVTTPYKKASTKDKIFAENILKVKKENLKFKKLHKNIYI
jgi:hypothetical protein